MEWDRPALLYNYVPPCILGQKKVGYIKKTLVGVHVPHGATAADDWAPVFSICVHMCI